MLLISEKLFVVYGRNPTLLVVPGKTISRHLLGSARLIEIAGIANRIGRCPVMPLNGNLKCTLIINSFA